MHYRHFMPATLAVLCMLGGMLGCGSHGSANADMSTGTDQGSSAALDVACTSWATSYCAQLQKCNPFQTSLNFKDVNDCMARYKLVCTPKTTLTATGLSSTGLTACAQAISTAACGDFLSGSNFLAAACRFPGTLAAGQNCGDDSQCSSGSCKATMSNGCGQCVTRMADGSTCTANGECNYASVCFGPVQARKCVAAADTGGTCSGTIPCKAGLYCTGGVCAAQLAASATCTSTGGECNATKGLYCDPAMNQCKAYGTAQLGGACGQLGTTRVQCTAGAGCFGVMLSSRTCVAPAVDGAACDSALASGGPGCQTNASCVGSTPPMGTCMVFDPSVCK